MNIISCNVNGLNAFKNHGGLEDIISNKDPDIFVMQETKCSDEWFKNYTEDYSDKYLRLHQQSNYKNGYAGVGIMYKKDLNSNIINTSSIELGASYESGRILNIEFNDFNLIGVYTLNSGGKDELRINFDREFEKYIKSISKPVIIVGDINIVPGYLDYWGNYNCNRNTSPGLMDFEKDGFEHLLEACDLKDSFRELNNTTRKYSWFSYRYNAYDLNHGWRLDNALVSESIMNLVLKSDILDDVRYSDHCPIQLILK